VIHKLISLQVLYLSCKCTLLVPFLSQSFLATSLLISHFSFLLFSLLFLFSFSFLFFSSFILFSSTLVLCCLPDNKIGPEETKALASALSHIAPSLTELHLSGTIGFPLRPLIFLFLFSSVGNKIRDAGLISLAPVIRKSTKLRVLDLASECIPLLQLLSQSFPAFFFSLTLLTLSLLTLSLSFSFSLFSPLFSPLFFYSHPISSLLLSMHNVYLLTGNVFGAEGAQGLSSSLPYVAPSLKELDLTSTLTPCHFFK
jgi:hypothetical protein